MEFKPEKTSLETVEPNEARKEEVGIVIEKAKKERLTLGKVVLSRLASLAISAIPLAGSIKN